MVSEWLWTWLLNSYKSSWEELAESVPHPLSQSAAGTFGDFIYILGGQSPYNQSLLRYDTLSDTFLDFGNSNLPFAVSGYGQYYTQIDETLYMISSDTQSLYSYDMSTNTMEWMDIESLHDGGCLASTQNQLFIIGAMSTVQVYDLSMNQWLSDIASTNINHEFASCIVDELGMLYIIGGAGTDSIEIMDTRSIQYNHYNASWHFIDSLTTGLYGLRSVLSEHEILVLGGFDHLDRAQKAMHIIDTETFSVSLLSEVMLYESAAMSVVVVNRVIYAFGGEGDDGNTLDTAMRYQLSTETVSPTMTPTADPMTEPTTKPMVMTTDLISTESPSFDSVSTTLESTANPTSNPTTIPVTSISTESPSTSSLTPSPIIVIAEYSENETIAINQEHEFIENLNDDEFHDLNLWMITTFGLILILLCLMAAVIVVFVFGTKHREIETVSISKEEREQMPRTSVTMEVEGSIDDITKSNAPSIADPEIEQKEIEDIVSIEAAADRPHRYRPRIVVSRASRPSLTDSSLLYGPGQGVNGSNGVMEQSRNEGSLMSVYGRRRRNGICAPSLTDSEALYEHKETVYQHHFRYNTMVSVSEQREQI